MRKCPVCHSGSRKVVIDLGNHPLADTFLPLDRRLEPVRIFPLLLMRCDDCSHFFSGYPTEPEERYVAHDYSYETANSAISVRHFREFADASLRVTRQTPGRVSVLDVGSNDGTLLEEFKKLGVARLVGVDPSPNLAKIADRRGLRTEVCFFTPENVGPVLEANAGAPYDLIVSANVFNHADDPHNFLESVRVALSDEGVFAFEVPSVVDLISFRAFETIYHEHVQYWSLGSLKKVLGGYGFKIFRFEFVDYMCGSIRVFASKDSLEDSSLAPQIERERATVVDNWTALSDFSKHVEMIKIQSLEYLYSRKLAGARIVAIGAATKGNTLLNYFGLGDDVVAYVTDTAKEKIGKIMPGSRIPIVHDDALADEPENTIALILPWNLDNALRQKFAGQKFEIFTPQLAFGLVDGSERPGIYGTA